jgi:hypothetical protein
VAYKQQNFFLIIVEAEHQRSRCQHGWVLVKVLFRWKIAVIPMHAHMVKREQARFVASYRCTSLMHEDSAFLTPSQPKCPTTLYHHTGYQISLYECGVGTNIWAIKVSSENTE